MSDTVDNDLEPKKVFLNSGDDSRYKALFENSIDAILIIEGNTFVDCNLAAVKMLRYNNREEVLQSHPSDLSPELQIDGQLSFGKANEMMAVAIKNGSHRFEWSHMRADGEVFPVEVLLTVMPADDINKEAQIHTVWRDISQRKLLEDQLRHSQKMEAVGRLAGGIAHDFNNQLVPILGYCELLSDSLADRPELLAFINEIERAGSRATSLVRKLMMYSRKDERQEVTLELNEVMSGLIPMLQQLIGEDVHLKYFESKVSLAVTIDPGDLAQIIINIISNARDAMPSGGNVEISLSMLRRATGDLASIEISDDGIGMSVKTQERIFEPFFTTKSLGAGTGLGLSGVFERVVQVGGSISCSSESGNGAVFKIFLPIETHAHITELPSSTVNVQGQVDESVGSSPQTILIVEDDCQVSKLSCQVLTNNGYQVNEAASAEAALELLSLGLIPDLILCDVILRGKSGPEMVNEISKLGVSMPVLFMSGYTDDRLALHGFDSSKVALLRKPFTPTNLLQKIMDVMS